MPAAAVAGPVADNLLDAFGAGWPCRREFSSARSALAAFLKARRVRRVWLPAYVCPALAQGVAAASAEVRFYGVSEALEPDPRPIASLARAGDAVVCIAFFGRGQAPALAELSRSRPDLCWIEDRAQSAEPASPGSAQAAIHSPRKLIGVADGGLLFTREPMPGPSVAAADLWAPEDARALDPDGLSPQDWYGLYQEREASFSGAPAAMSERSLAALAAASAEPLAEARKRNWRRLASRLEDRALWRMAEPEFVPMAFPIVVADAAEAVQSLAAERIWAPRHWPVLPSPAADFPEAHRLSTRLVSLPCDQRYGEADMDRVAEAALCLRPNQPR